MYKIYIALYACPSTEMVSLRMMKTWCLDPVPSRLSAPLRPEKSLPNELYSIASRFPYQALDESDTA
jgi:hypothetical protein